MKKLLMIILFALLSMPLIAQDKLFIVMEMMHVDNEQESAYAQTEQFWKKIHEQRVADGSILGWDLWSLLPGGEDQGYQFATVTVYDSAEKMMAPMDIMKYAKAAYPDMSEEELWKKISDSGKSRDLAVRIFMHQIAMTHGDFKMKVGTVATMEFMKVALDKYDAYESAEINTFQPLHQKMVDAGAKGSWEMLRFMIPVGSDTYASHLTVNMYENMEQYLNADNYQGDEPTEAQQKAIMKGLDTRDMKIVNVATLVEMVR